MSKLGEIWNDWMDRTGIALFRDSLPGPQFDQDVVLDVPGYRQSQDYTCGFAAGLMVLHTVKPKASIDRFYHRVAPDPDEGTPTTRLVQALRASGIGVSVKKGLLFEDFASAIRKGFPVITCVKTDQRDEKGNPIEHWVTVYGVGTKPNRIFVAGVGWRGLWKVKPWAQFNRELTSERIGLVCWGK